jgi:hypothetical protein
MAWLRELPADVVEGLVMLERREVLYFSGGVDSGEDFFLGAGGELAAFAGFLHDLMRQPIAPGGSHDFVVIDASGFKHGIEGLNAHKHSFGIGLGDGRGIGLIGHGWGTVFPVEVAVVGGQHKQTLEESGFSMRASMALFWWREERSPQQSAMMRRRASGLMAIKTSSLGGPWRASGLEGEQPCYPAAPE